MNRVGNASRAPVHGAFLGRFRDAGRLAGAEGPCHRFFRLALRIATANPELETVPAGFLRTRIPEIPANYHCKKTVRLWKKRASHVFRAKMNGYISPRGTCSGFLFTIPCAGGGSRLLTPALSPAVAVPDFEFRVPGCLDSELVTLNSESYDGAREAAELKIENCQLRICNFSTSSPRPSPLRGEGDPWLRCGLIRQPSDVRRRRRTKGRNLALPPRRFGTEVPWSAAFTPLHCK